MILAGSDARPINEDLRAVKAELGPSTRDADGFRGPYQGLRGDTPYVYSGAADLAGLDKGYPSPQRGCSIRSRKATQTGTEHDKVVSIHGCPPLPLSC